MKSMLAKQSPHNSPWLPMRRRQAMQTGGKSRSASQPNAGRRKSALAGFIAGEAGGAARLSSPSPIGMTAMIERGGPNFKARSVRVR